MESSFFIFQIIRLCILTVFFMDLHSDQSTDRYDHAACKEDDM